MSNRTLYKKVDGKFIPVKEYDPIVMDALPEGYHLISVRPGIRSTRYDVDPDVIGLLAATILLEDELLSMIVEASRSRPSRVPITVEQKEAWDQLCEVFGQEIHLVNPSPADVVRRACAHLVMRAANITDVPENKETIEYLRSIIALLKK